MPFARGHKKIQHSPKTIDMAKIIIEEKCYGRADNGVG